MVFYWLRVFLGNIDCSAIPLFIYQRPKYRGIYRNKWYIKWYINSTMVIMAIYMSIKINFAVYYDHIWCIKWYLKWCIWYLCILSRYSTFISILDVYKLVVYKNVPNIGLCRNKWYNKWYIYYKSIIMAIYMSIKIGFTVYYDSIWCIKWYLKCWQWYLCILSRYWLFISIFNVYKLLLYTNVPNIGVYIEIYDILNDI